jgi:hypothetical protein
MSSEPLPARIDSEATAPGNRGRPPHVKHDDDRPVTRAR